VNLRLLIILLSLPLPGVTAQEQAVPPASSRNFAILRRGASIDNVMAQAVRVVPSPRQAAWQEREFTAFVHFGMNTFTNREWGDGTESRDLFRPSGLDARQWARIFKRAGMKMIILTAKHHDGFCLWPSRHTEHSVKGSPWKDGKGDVVRDVADACREYGLKFGIYLSPWDRHERSYGDSPRYNAFFRAQLRELLTEYGEIAEVWFDGACAEGPNGKKQEYDWASYYDVIRELQPGAVIFGMGPDVRWVGTESGSGRETEWSVIPDVLRDPGPGMQDSSGFSVDHAFLPGDLTGEDLGSREKIQTAHSLIWYPAETDVSIRPGWFYHPEQDRSVKGPAELVDIYYKSVGRNGVLLLNVPADARGRIHASDSSSLAGMRGILERTFARDLVGRAAAVRASGQESWHEALHAVDHVRGTSWTPAAGAGGEAWLEVAFNRPADFNVAMFAEFIHTGQRVERFRVDAWDGKAWKNITRGTTIGAKRLIRFPTVTAERVKLVIEESRATPAISAFGLFRGPDNVSP
jgi:alpha-L-fucosidase